MESLGATERGEVEQWLQASMALQRALAPKAETSAVAVAAAGPGGFELWLCMTVQTPLLASKLGLWKDAVPGLRTVGLGAAVSFPKEGALVLEGASHVPVALLEAARVMLSTHSELESLSQASDANAADRSVAGLAGGGLTARVVLFLKQQLGALLPQTKGRYTDGESHSACLERALRALGSGFLPALTWCGKQHGFVFKSAEFGLGYYPDQSGSEVLDLGSAAAATGAKGEEASQTAWQFGGGCSLRLLTGAVALSPTEEALLKELPDLEYRAALGATNIKDSGSAARNHGSSLGLKNGEFAADVGLETDGIFLEMYAGMLDVLAPTHRGGFAGLYSAASQGRFTADCDLAAACHCEDMHANVITKEISAKFESEGYVVLKGVLTADEVAAAHADVSTLLDNGTMRPNPQEEKWMNKRDDDIALIGVAHLGHKMPGLRRAIEMVRGVPHALQQWENCEADVEVPREVMLACYDGKVGRPAKHQPHRDNAPIPGTAGENTREITVLCYLNKEWEPEWGGQLRCHPNAELTDPIGTNPSVVDVQPEGGTMVVFKSRTLLHEVLPSHRRRFAITQWNMKISAQSGAAPASDNNMSIHTWQQQDGEEPGECESGYTPSGATYL